MIKGLETKAEVMAAIKKAKAVYVRVIYTRDDDRVMRVSRKAALEMCSFMSENSTPNVLLETEADGTYVTIG